MTQEAVYLMRLRPEVRDNGQNRLATLQGAPLELFGLVALHVCYGRSLESDDLREAFYEGKTYTPESNVIDRYMSEIYRVLLPTEARNKEALHTFLTQAFLDVRELDSWTRSRFTEPTQVMKALDQVISLYQGGLLPMWNYAWLQDDRARLQGDYLRFWAKSAQILRSAGNEKELNNMIDKALEFHVDPQSKEHEELSRLREQDSEEPKEREKPRKKKRGKALFDIGGIKNCDEVNIAKTMYQNYNL